MFLHSSYNDTALYSKTCQMGLTNFYITPPCGTLSPNMTSFQQEFISSEQLSNPWVVFFRFSLALTNENYVPPPIRPLRLSYIVRLGFQTDSAHPVFTIPFKLLLPCLSHKAYTIFSKSFQSQNCWSTLWYHILSFFWISFLRRWLAELRRRSFIPSRKCLILTSLHRS